MEAINSRFVFGEPHIALKEELALSVDKETVKNLMEHYDEPSNFFKGAVFGFILCVPFWTFWAVIFWLITR
jgi:hypothetical protein